MPYDLMKLQFSTVLAKREIESTRNRLKRFDLDKDRDERRAQHTCPRCWYLRGARIVGHGYTRWTCRSCGVEDTHSNTGVPELCDSCCEKYGACRECSGDVNCKARKRLEKR